MIIRHAAADDLPEMLRIYETAKAFMRAHGNMDQWNDGYPKPELLLDDIAKGQSYVVLEEGRIAGTFAFILGPDRTYAEINGSWLNDEPYGTIHRSASDGTIHGLVREITKFGLQFTNNIRVDTHEKNSTMRKTVESLGYKYCGIIHIDNGAERVAFQLDASKNL